MNDKLENLDQYKDNVNCLEKPAVEAEYFCNIFNYWQDLLRNGRKDYNGPLIGSVEEVIKLLKQKKETQSLNGKESKSGSELRQEAEYELFKEQIDYKNEQLNKLMAYIESQPIWKYKFSTKNENGTEFAGQNVDSIYYLSNSGSSLRLKKDGYLLYGIETALQKPDELFFCINDREENYIDPKKDKNSTSFPVQCISHDPKINFRVEEFFTTDFWDHKQGDFKSKISITENEDRFIVSNYDGEHLGHYINKIEEL